MAAILLFPALFFAVVGANMLSTAEAIAARRKSRIWASARPEFGGAILCFGVALLCAFGAAP